MSSTDPRPQTTDTQPSSTPKYQETPLARYARLLNYNPNTGLFTWRERTLLSDFKRKGFDDSPRTLALAADKWNQRNAGKPAMQTRTSRGTLQGVVMGVPVQAHALAFAMHWGDWPKGQIDHYDCDRTNNCIWNLRDVDKRMASMIRVMRGEPGAPATWGVSPRELWGLTWVYAPGMDLGSQEGMVESDSSSDTVLAGAGVGAVADSAPTSTTPIHTPPATTPQSSNPMARGSGGRPLSVPNTGERHEH